MTLPTVTLTILAGGPGSRMGIPKAWLTLRGRPVLEDLLDRLHWPGPTLLITHPGRANPPGHQRFTREVQDDVANQGPLRGLLTALDSCDTPLLVVATVDMPKVQSLHLAHLHELLATQPNALGLMLTRQSDDARSTELEPFPSAWRTEARTLIASQLDAGQRSLHSLMRRPGVLTLPSPPGWPRSVWTNLNHPDDLAALDGEST